MKLRYTDRSKDDVELAFAWYERQRRGLGFEFLDCVEAALQNRKCASQDRLDVSSSWKAP